LGSWTNTVGLFQNIVNLSPLIFSRFDFFVKGRSKVGINGKVSKFFKYLVYFMKCGMDKGRGEIEVK